MIKDTIILEREEFEKLDYTESFKSEIEACFGKDRKVKEVIIILDFIN